MLLPSSYSETTLPPSGRTGGSYEGRIEWRSVLNYVRYTLFRVASVQTISGTGANHLGGLFLERHYQPWKGKSVQEKEVWLSNPTWGENSFMQRHAHTNLLL